MTRVVVLSGGLDSTVTLATAIEQGNEAPLAVSFDYGQTHGVELESARAVAAHYHVPLEVIDVRGLLTGGALLGEGDIPTSEYDADTMASTVVHARNMLFASIAVSRAGDGGEVWLGVHGGDHHIYPDCRESFWAPYSLAVRTAYNVDVVLPYLTSSKADIVRSGHKLDAPMELTWSCYKGGSVQCGECGTCLERREAFAAAGVTDLTRYEENEHE